MRNLRNTLVWNLARRVKNNLRALLKGYYKYFNYEGVSVKYHLSDPVSFNFFTNDYWYGDMFEPGVTKHLIKTLRRSKVFLDVGANLGYYSIIASKMVEQVISVEMDLKNTVKLRKNVRLNRSVGNVKVVQKAVGNKNGYLSYYKRGSEINSLTNAIDDLVLDRDKARVEVRTINDIIIDSPYKPDVIKIDIEGAEFMALEGARDYIEKNQPLIYCEIHLHKGPGSIYSFGHSPEDVFIYFSGLNYKIETLPVRPEHLFEHLKEINNANELMESVMLFCSPQ
jgi:FkbM family methyltransferase